MDLDQEIAEQATGIRASVRNGGPFYADGGAPLTDEEAQDALLEGRGFYVPNAGAGSYRAVLERVGFSKVELAQSGSSAGDWTMLAFDGTYWLFICQSNRYPYYGFQYGMADPMVAFDSKDEAYAFLESLG